MSTIIISIDGHLHYNLELQDAYEANDFIPLMRGHLDKIERLQFVLNGSENRERNDYVERDVVATNKLFSELSSKIESIGNDIIKENHKTMTSYKFKKKVEGGRGFAWLAPRGNSLIVYFKKDNNEFDTNNKLIRTGTFGDYPLMTVRNQDDIGYAFNIIKSIYKKYR